MSNFRFSSLGVVNPYDVLSVTPGHLGASEVLTSAVEYPTVAEAVADCVLVVGTTAVRHREIQHALRRVEYGSGLIAKQMVSGRVGDLIRLGKWGSPTADLSHCDWLMRIPSYGDQISMNLGQAVAICLYELIRDGRGHVSRRKAENRRSREQRPEISTASQPACSMRCMKAATSGRTPDAFIEEKCGVWCTA